MHDRKPPGYGADEEQDSDVDTIEDRCMHTDSLQLYDKHIQDIVGDE